MKVYISKNGQQMGPYSVEELNQMLESETISGDDLCWYEGCETWVPLSAFPGFVPPLSPSPGPPPSPNDAPDTRLPANMPTAPEQAGLFSLVVPKKLQAEMLGYALLGIPLLAAALIWLGDTGATLATTATVIATASLAFIDAKLLGIGSVTHLNAKGQTRNGPKQWFAFTLLLWVIGYPVYLYARSRYGVRNLALPGIIVVLLGVPVLFPQSSPVIPKATKSVAQQSPPNSTFRKAPPVSPIPQPVVIASAQTPASFASQTTPPSPTVATPRTTEAASSTQEENVANATPEPSQSPSATIAESSLAISPSVSIQGESPSYDKAAANCAALIEQNRAALRKEYVEQLNSLATASQRRGDLPTLQEIRKYVDVVQNGNFNKYQEILYAGDDCVITDDDYGTYARVPSAKLLVRQFVFSDFRGVQEIADLSVRICAAAIKQLTSEGNIADATTVQKEILAICDKYKLDRDHAFKVTTDLTLPGFVTSVKAFPIIPQNSNDAAASVNAALAAWGGPPKFGEVFAVDGDTGGSVEVSQYFAFSSAEWDSLGVEILIPINCTDFAIRSQIRKAAYAMLSKTLFTGKSAAVLGSGTLSGPPFMTLDDALAFYVPDNALTANSQLEKGKFYRHIGYVFQVTDKYALVDKSGTGPDNHGPPWGILYFADPNKLDSISIDQGVVVQAVVQFAGFKSETMSSGAESRLALFKCVALQNLMNNQFVDCSAEKTTETNP